MSVTKLVRSRTLPMFLALGVAACSDVTTGPPGFSPEAGPLMETGTSGGVSGRGQESGSRVFVIAPGVAVLEKFGDHYISIPANAVCDPATSGYGPALWDAPCAPLGHSIQVTATWSVVNGRPVIKFSPDLRFVPSNDQNRWVQLGLKDTKGVDPDLYYTILWYNPDLGRMVDESAADPTLKAHPYSSGNLVVRRLKHFSDYDLWSGYGNYYVTSGLGGAEETLGLGGAW